MRNIFRSIVVSSVVASCCLYGFENEKVNYIQDSSLQTHKNKKVSKKDSKKNSISKKDLKSKSSGQISLEKAFEFYKQGEYVKSYKEAIEYTKKYPESIDAWLLAGDSAFRLGDFDRAIAAFDCVLILDENNIHAHLESAKIYVMGGNKELLKLEIDALLKLDILNPQDKKDFKELLDALNENSGIFYGSIDAGLFFDNNPFAETKERKEFNKTKSSVGSVLGANLGYEYHFSDNYSINIDGGFYDKHYFEGESEYRAEKYPHFRFFSIYASPKYNFESSSLGLSFSYSYMLYQDKKFMHSPSVGINFSSTQANGFGFDTSFDYTSNLFLGEYKEKSSKNSDNLSNDYYHLSLSTAFKYMFNNNLIYTRFYGSRDRMFSNPRVKDDITTDYDGLGLMINYNRFFDNFYANIGYSLDFSKFKEAPFGYDKRNDFTNRFFAGYTYMLSRQFSAALNLSYTKRLSSVDGSKNNLDYNYNQLYWQFGFRYNF